MPVVFAGARHIFDSKTDAATPEDASTGVAVSPDFEHLGGDFHASYGFACTADNGLAAIVTLCKASASGPTKSPCGLISANPPSCK